MSETRFIWRRVSSGLTFIGFGVFFFLSAQGLLHRGFWIEALSFWPVCLIALGLRMIFDRSRAPWAVLLSPLLLMSVLGYVAWRGAEAPSTDWRSVAAARDRSADAWELRADVALVDLDLRAGSVAAESLLRGRMAPSDRGRVRVSDRGDASRVYLSSGRWSDGEWVFLPTKRQHWDLELTDDLPLGLRLSSAFASGTIDLEAGEVTDVRIDGAFNDLELRLGTPRVDTRVELDGAFNRMQLVVPEATPVVTSSDGLANLVDRRSGGAGRHGAAYRLHSDGAFNEVVVRSK